MSEIEIVALCRKQDRVGERLLFKKYYTSMLGLCRRYVSDEYAAKEVLSDGFVKVFHHLDTFEFREGKGLKSWIKNIMINEALMYLRKHRKFQKNVSLDEVYDAPGVQQVESMDAELIHKAIRDLPPGYRTVLNMSLIEGFSHKEISEKLNIAEAASRSQLARARKKLQESLKGML
ncbi:sigma-70 family RNA polymerase sigma factor [Fulvivirga sp. M361]|uniref:RNA polymerase sigma factor n=1 Tax=Fulvivirga sp. M361 TaxID=2594266 RepID=UPI00117ADBD8|nr:sigma-70 family RNA polymerase sigma factor [Fulvivirga sp. M361]TRX60729.1 sigma-70 family RNA polymerase sigma factor [Fulvivirga sp. M361]